MTGRMRARSRRSPGVVLVAVLVGGLALGACGGGDDDADRVTPPDGAAEEGDTTSDDDGRASVGQGDLPDPCELVTRADAEALFGEPAVQADDAAPVNVGEGCIWANVGGDEFGRVGHLLQVRAFAGEQFYSAELYDNAEPVDGLGERSYVAIGDGLAGVDLQFVQDGVVVHLNYSVINIGVEGDRIEASEKADDVVRLARQAADRM